MPKSWSEIQTEINGKAGLTNDMRRGSVEDLNPDDSVPSIRADADYYPGSRMPIPTELPRPGRAEVPDVDPSWRELGKEYMFKGRATVMFPIGALAKALGRDATTIRSWEQKGWLPKPVSRGAEMGHGGHRRLYTAVQIERLVAAAHECGLLVDVSKRRVLPGKTRFPELAAEILKPN